MLEVEVLRASDDMLDHYIQLYKRKYGVSPLIKNGPYCQQMFGILLRRIGRNRTKKLLELFMNTDDPWYVKQSHSVGCFEKNTEVLNGMLGKIEQRELSAGDRNLRVMTQIACPKCGRRFYTTCLASEIEKSMLTNCSNCL